MPQTFSDNDFVYSVDMMFAYLKNNDHPISVIKVKEYLDVLEYPGWGDPAANIRYSALNVIETPMKFQDDYKRILTADLTYPIIIADNGYIIDGVHRLSKAHLEGRDEMKAYFFDENLMKKFIIAEKTEDVWNKIDHMPIYELIDLYHKNFCAKSK